SRIQIRVDPRAPADPTPNRDSSEEARAKPTRGGGAGPPRECFADAAPKPSLRGGGPPGLRPVPWGQGPPGAKRGAGALGRAGVARLRAGPPCRPFSGGRRPSLHPPTVP